MGPQLRDIHVPPEPGWWPPAPGWWLLGLVLVAGLIWLVPRMRAWQERNRWRRGVRRAYATMAREAAGLPQARAIAQVSEFLRRAVRASDPAAAALAGRAWIDYLNATGSHAFDAETAELLQDGAYRPQVEGDVAALVAAAGDWLEAWLQGVRHA
ncbi:MAG TPA: DUF4381 domain-containing protein [Xanthomonadaceae bacterium]|nr:DUF4381 domain-containing protein [Xanthomonadaceae bacterium]